MLHSSKMFSFNRATQIISCESSDLRDREGQSGFLFDILTVDRQGQPLTYGLTIESVRTKQAAAFELAHTFRDTENDITHWELRPTHQTLLQQPQINGWTLHIFND